MLAEKEEEWSKTMQYPAVAWNLIIPESWPRLMESSLRRWSRLSTVTISRISWSQHRDSGNYYQGSLIHPLMRQVSLYIF